MSFVTSSAIPGRGQPLQYKASQCSVLARYPLSGTLTAHVHLSRRYTQQPSAQSASGSTPGVGQRGLCLNPERCCAGQKRRDAPSIVLPQQDADVISHIALDIGGSLIKLVYFSPDVPPTGEGASGMAGGSGSGNGRSGGGARPAH